MSEGKSRPLLETETKIINLLKNFEQFIDSKQLTTTITIHREGATQIAKIPGLRIFKAEVKQDTGEYILTFTKTEYARYVEYITAAVGMTLLLDGSLITFDKLTISNEYLNK